MRLRLYCLHIMVAVMVSFRYSLMPSKPETTRKSNGKHDKAVTHYKSYVSFRQDALMTVIFTYHDGADGLSAVLAQAQQIHHYKETQWQKR